MRLRLLFIFFVFCLSAGAQQPQVQYTMNKNELEARRKELMETIKQTEEQLEATKKNKNATMGQLRALQAKLSQRQRLISNMNDEIGQINSTITQSSHEVVTLKENLEVLKIRYAQSLRYSYQNHSSYDMMAFLFSSDNFNDAMRRIKYLKKYRDYRKGQVDQIRVTQGQIEHKIVVLNTQKQQKDELLTTQEQQKQVLQKETSETDKVVQDLKGQEKQLMAEIEKNRKIAARVNKAINDVIRREIEEERKKALLAEQKRKQEEDRLKALANNPPNPNTTTANNTTTKPNNSNIKTTTNGTTTKPNNTEVVTTVRPKPKPANYDLNLTPEANALSNSFEANRGKLPWPVEKGFISGYFGKHPDPVEKKVMIETYGVDIRTSEGATVRAVFDGTVTSVLYIPGKGWVAIVNHGKYFSIYSGLANVIVKKGDAVHTKQTLGTIDKNDEGEPILDFEIWKGGNKIDPAPWIAH